MTKERLLEYIYYQLLPKVYRDEDALLKRPLYRFFKSIIYGGFNVPISTSTNFTGITKADKCPETIFPYLYNSNGLTYSNLVSTQLQRRFLSDLEEVYKRRGTYSGVKYLVRVLTGYDAETIYTKYVNESGETVKLLTVNVKGMALSEVENIETGLPVVREFIKDFIPFSVDVEVYATFGVSELSMTHNTVIQCQQYKHEIISNEEV